MTREQLDAIRARVEAALTYEPTDNEEEQYCPLCEDGYVNGQRYDAKEALAATIVAYGIGEGLHRAKEWVKNAPADLLALLAEVERLTAELHRMKSRPVEAEFSRLDTMWQQLVRERDEAVHELRCLKGDRSEVNTAKLNDAFTEGTLKAGDAMRPLIADAFARGVAAMREAAANVKYSCGYCSRAALQRKIRALPDPEDK